MARRRKPGDGALDLSTAQIDALALLHAYCDRQAVSGPGQPDTPAHREAREMRTRLEQAFPSAFPPPPSPIVTASG